MNGIDMFLVQYGLAAVFIVLLAKSIGLPIPIPADVIILATAIRAAEGKLILWQAFLAILVALVLGGIIQFVLVRGPGRSLLYRFGRYIGLTSARLDAAAAKIKKGGLTNLCAWNCTWQRSFSLCALFPRLPRRDPIGSGRSCPAISNIDNRGAGFVGDGICIVGAGSSPAKGGTP